MDLHRDYEYHAPTDEKKVLHNMIRQKIGGTAQYINDLVPNCRERSLAFTKLEEAMFWANAAIAREDLPE